MQPNRLERSMQHQLAMAHVELLLSHKLATTVRRHEIPAVQNTFVSDSLPRCAASWGRPCSLHCSACCPRLWRAAPLVLQAGCAWACSQQCCHCGCVALCCRLVQGRLTVCVLQQRVGACSQPAAAARQGSIRSAIRTVPMCRQHSCSCNRRMTYVTIRLLPSASVSSLPCRTVVHCCRLCRCCCLHCNFHMMQLEAVQLLLTVQSPRQHAQCVLPCAVPWPCLSEWMHQQQHLQPEHKVQGSDSARSTDDK
jgi:hypothetical protein